MDDEQIVRLLNELSSDESFDLGSDIDEIEVISQRSYESVSEEELEPFVELPPVPGTSDASDTIERPYARYVYGKDQTKWSKDCCRTNVRTRS